MNSPRWLSVPIALLIIAIVTFVVFAPVVSFHFTSWDDYDTVARNPLLNPPTARSLEAFWTRPHGDLYIPATYTLWFMTAGVAQQSPTPASPFAMNPHVFHALNILLHIGSACVVFALLNLLIRHSGAALIGALLFAVHPVQVESVAWVSGMKDVLFGLLSLIAIWQYLLTARDAKTATKNQRRGRYAIVTFFFILAMLAKPTAIMVPLVVIVLDHLMLGRSVREVLRSAWPWLLLAIPCVVWTKLAQPALHAHSAAAPIWSRSLVAADAIAFYLYKLILPLSLTFDYGRSPARAIEQGWIYWTWSVPLAIALLAIALVRRTRIPATASLVFVIVLLPVLGLVPFDFQAYSTVADHYLYLAMLGPAILVAGVATNLAKQSRNGLIGVIIAIMALLGIRSFAQTFHWRDSNALFTHGIESNPRSFASLGSLAASAVETRNSDRALEWADRAIAINPTYASAYVSRAEALRQKGDLPAAEKSYRDALQHDPAFPAALNNLAALLAEQGRLDEAIPVAQQSIKASPDSVMAHLNLGRMYFQTGNVDAAKREFQVVLQLDPANPIARDLLAELSPK